MVKIANAISVGIGMDTAQFRRDVNYANRIIGQAKSAFRDLGQTMDLINQDYKDGALTQAEYTAAVNKATLASERKAAQLRQEAAAVKEIERANAAAAAAERARAQNSLGLGSYSGAKPGVANGSGGSVNGYLNSQQTVANAAKANADAIRQSQSALSGWENGLKRINQSGFARDLARSRSGADAWAAGVRNMANAAREAAQAADTLTREAREAAAALRQSGTGYLQQFENSQQRLNRQLAEARGYYRSGAITATEYGQAVRQIHRQNSALVAGFAQFKGVMLSTVGPVLLTYKALQGLKASITLSAELDAARAKFRVFTGSVVQAEKILREVRSLSATAPVSFQGGQRAIATMLQFGVASKDVVVSLKQMAEITGGDTQRLESLALAFAQSQAAGRLMGQDLLQMVNAGFNPLKVISEQTGQSLVELKKQMEAGGISSEAVAKAFKDATAEGGRFNGLLAEIADTTSGKLTKAYSSIQQLGTAIGQAIDPEVRSSLSFIAKISQELTDALSGPQELTFFDDVKKQLDDAKYALGRKDSSAITAIIATAGIDRAKLVKDIELYETQLKTLKNIEQVRERMASGKFVTVEQRRVVEQVDQEKRTAKEANQSEYNQLRAQLAKDLQAARTVEEQLRLKVQFVDDVGAGYISDGDLANIAAFRKQLEGFDADAAKAKRSASAFADAIKEAQESQLSSRYGDNANRLKLLVASSADTERSNKDGTGLQDLVDQGAAYDQIYAAANQAARAEADRLAILEDANRAEVFRQEMDNLASQAKYLEEAVSWGKEEARIRQLMRDDGLSRSEAELKRAAEDRLKAEEKIKELRDTAKELKDNSTNFDRLVNGVAELQALLQLGFIDQSVFDREANKLASSADQKYGTAGAPRAIQAGSAEAFALQAENQAKVISENIRLANRAFTVQKATSEAAKKTSDILDDIKDNLGVLPTP
jgi:tape measure domain-containing protein